MRLIDADKIEINEECTFSGKGIKAFLDAIPTAYDVDKVVEQMEERIENFKSLNSDDEIVDVAIKETQRNIEIVKSGGIE